MSEELSDLPEEAVEHAVRMWRRGDKSHLPADQRDHIRIGVFFPKPAELREIARYYLRERESLARKIETAEGHVRELELISEEHPELYIALRCPKCEEPLITFGEMDWSSLGHYAEEQKKKGDAHDASHASPLRCPKCEEPLVTFTCKQAEYMRRAVARIKALRGYRDKVAALREQMAQFPAGIYDDYDDEIYWQPSDQS